MYISGTTLEIPLIPLIPVAELLSRAAPLRLKCISEESYAPDSIDAALLSLLAQGSRTPDLGLLPISRSLLDDEALMPAIVRFALPIGLRNFSNELPDHASENHGIAGIEDIRDLMLLLIRNGELDTWDELGLDDEEIHPLSAHAELSQRAKVERAHEAARHLPGAQLQRARASIPQLP